jgi:predicted MPP superfamily phosphohydrolase
LALPVSSLLAWYAVPYLGACLGHGVWLIFWQNWLSGVLLDRPRLKVVRKVNLSLILSGPVLIGLLFHAIAPCGAGFDITGAHGWQLPVVAYLVLCWLVGLVIAPMFAVRYWLRRRPEQLLYNDTMTVDVAALLGRKPAGRGKRAFLARLPGNQVFQVDFAERTFALPRLPAAWDGLSILQLSDLHLSGTPERPFFERVMDRCREWEFDLLALTGDVVDSHWHHRWILPLLGKLRWRVAAFAILGNHDWWHGDALCRRRLRRLGMQVLENRWVQLDVRGESLVVIGHEGPWFGPPPDLSDCPADGFRLLLSHTPDNLAWARRHGVDLMLSGHTHGGQIRLPLIGSVFVPSRLGRRYDCGSFFRPPTLLHVSRGLSGETPVRYLCRPEVTRIVLRRASG